MSILHPIRFLLIAALWLALVPAASAQTSSTLILVPWSPDKKVESFNTYWGGFDGEISGPDKDITLNQFSSTGRARAKTSKPHWVLGWRFNQLNITASDPAPPERLSEQAVVAGKEFGQIGNWTWGAIGGIGYAGNAPYNDSDAWFGIASLAAYTRLDNGATLTVLLDYDGNRNVFPDLPLPSIGYTNNLNEKLQYVVGFPINAVTYRPDDNWLLRARWIFPESFTLDAEYAFNQNLALFAGYRKEITGYQLSGDSNKRRLFFDQKRIELGARWRPADKIEIVAAGGYAFDTSFERGWDIRETDTVREVSDEPFVRIALNIRF